MRNWRAYLVRILALFFLSQGDREQLRLSAPPGRRFELLADDDPSPDIEEVKDLTLKPAPYLPRKLDAAQRQRLRDLAAPLVPGTSREYGEEVCGLWVRLDRASTSHTMGRWYMAQVIKVTATGEHLVRLKKDGDQPTYQVLSEFKFSFSGVRL